MYVSKDVRIRGLEAESVPRAEIFGKHFSRLSFVRKQFKGTQNILTDAFSNFAQF
jgi:hypothetical protein